MSCQPYFNENPCAYSFLNPRPWYHGYYESVTYSVLPFCFHPRIYLSEIYSPVTIDPSNLLVVVPSFSPVVFNHQQRESSYYGCAASEMNACNLEVLEKPNIPIPSGEKAIVKSHLSSSFEKTKFNKATIKAIASSKHPDTGAMEQIECRGEKKADTSSILDILQEPAYFQNYEIDNTFSEFQAETNSSISSQSCYLSASHLNLSKENPTYCNSSLNEKLEYVHEQQHNMFSARENRSGTDTDLDDTDFSHSKESQSEHKCNDLDDDSQLEYHSAEEYDYVDCNCLCRQETENFGVFKKKQLANEDTVKEHELPLNKVEEGFSAASCSTIIKDHYNCNEISTFPQIFQDVGCTEIQYKKDETQVMFYSGVEDSSHVEANKEYNSKLFSSNRAKIEENTKVNFLSDGTLTSVMPANKGMFKKNVSVSKNISQKTENPEILQQEKMLLPFHVSGSNPEGSNSCAYKQSLFINANIENCVYNSCGRHGQCRENFSNLESKCITNVSEESAKTPQSTVNQAVDATADFRASFTTSRATNVSSSMVSKAQNTVITMMSKSRPKEWMGEYCKSVACNTDWSYIPDSLEMNESQIAMTDKLENCITSSTTTQGWKSNTEDPLDWSNGTNRDLNEIPYRMMQLSREMSNNWPNCCKELLQRAVKAEMQLLKIHYQMYQHCWQTCRYLGKGKENVSSSPLGSGKLLQEMLSQDNESPSLHLITAQMNVNSDLQQCPSNKNSEKRKTSLEEKSSLNTQEISEDWFDATENLTTIGSSVLCTDPLKVTGTETQATEDQKKVLKNNYCVHVGGLSPSVSEVDLWLHFQKYNVSEISICEFSKNYRYASLGFKTACDAKLAVKEMNEQEIKGKAVKVRLVRTIRENEVQDYQGCMKQKKKNDYIKNSDLPLEVTTTASATFTLPPDDPISLKQSVVSRDDFKSPFPVLPASTSSETPPCTSGQSKVLNSDNSSRKACFELKQEDIAEGLLPFGSVQFTPDPSSIFIPPNTLNLRSFRKVVKKLEELYPEISRDNILDALVEIKENKGFLSGLPLSTIVQMASSLLNKKFASQSEKRAI